MSWLSVPPGCYQPVRTASTVGVGTDAAGLSSASAPWGSTAARPCPRTMRFPRHKNWRTPRPGLIGQKPDSTMAVRRACRRRPGLARSVRRLRAATGMPAGGRPRGAAGMATSMELAIGWDEWGPAPPCGKGLPIRHTSI
jgi:hypothetical protein